MKKYLILLFSAVLAVHSFGQNMNVQSAANSLKDKDYAAAKNYIDKAAENEQTSNNYKMWYYRAKIYMAIFQDTAASVRSLDEDAASKAAVSFANCIKTDKSGWFIEECKQNAWITGLGLYNAGVNAYAAKDWARAEKCFKGIYDVFPLDAEKNLKRENITPESVNKNLYLVGMKSGNKTMAKEYLQKLMESNYNDPFIYIDMARIYFEDKDTAKGLSYLEKGREKFEENTDLVTEEVIIYEAMGKSAELVTKLTQAIEITPDNALLYVSRAFTFEKLKNQEKAKEDYLKALDIDDRNFIAAFNLGALIYNQGAALLLEANKIPDSKIKEYEAAKKKADDKLKESVPFLEKAYALDPKDKPTLQTLKLLYSRTGEQDKYNRIKTELDNLK